jgi:acetyl-CoA C-acetyltransferase
MARSIDSVLRDGLNDAFSDAHSGWHTEDLVEKYQVTRKAQDRWALQSQQRFAAAQADGHFKSQIVPVDVPPMGASAIARTSPTASIMR